MGPAMFGADHPQREATSSFHMGLHLDLDLTMINGQLRRNISQRLDALEDLHNETRGGKTVSWQPYMEDAMLDYTMGEMMEVQMPDMMEIASPVRKRKRTLDRSEEDRFNATRKARKIASLKRCSSHSSKQPLQATTPNTPPSKPAFLRPCRICHSSPKSKKHVAGFLSCSRCGGWTCSICQRYCQSGSCRYNQVPTCSNCCVEVGVHGEEYCRDCAYGIS